MNKQQQKYDRQIRLWKEHGQRALETANVCLLGATATGTETLKNLVLPGIASFTIVDDQKLCERDLGNNFFVGVEHLGLSRASCIAQLLAEMNEDVQGYSIESSVEELVTSKGTDFFEKFQLVIASNLSERVLLDLERVLSQIKVPLIVCQTNGLLGYLRLSLYEYTVIETHPENNVDLRIDCPWKELSDHCLEHDFSNMDSLQLGHVPYVVILIKTLALWKEKHNGHSPKAVEEKASFKKFVLEIGKGSNERENLDEALSQCYRAFQSTTIPSNILKLFDMASDASRNSVFWTLVRALKLFTERFGDGRLPLVGSIPDMKADTESFVKLQKIYREKAKLDRLNFKICLEEVDSDKRHSIDDDTLNSFCSNASHLKVLDYRSLAEEKESPRLQRLLNSTHEPESLCHWYLCFIFAEKFREQYKRFPGELGELENEVALFKKCAHGVLSAWGYSNPSNISLDEHIMAFCRGAGSEIHNMASLVGGIASQECLKVLTRQYIPLCNTMIFDGIHAISWTLDA